MKRKPTLILLFVLLCARMANAQEWTYYKDFPINVTASDIVSNNAGTLFLWTTDNRFFYKTINGNWREFRSNEAAPVNPSSISIDTNSNRIYVADDLWGGLYYSTNFGVTWQQSYFTTDPVSGFHEPVFYLSNVRNQNFYGMTGNGLLVNIVIKYTQLGQAAQFMEYDPSMSETNSATVIYQAANQKVLIGTQGGGIWVSDNAVTNFSHSNFNQHKIICFTENTNGRVYALGKDETGASFLIYSDDYNDWQYIDLPNMGEHYTTIHCDTVSQNLWLGSDAGIYKLQLTDSQTSNWTDGSFNNSQQSEIKIMGDSNGNIYNVSYQKIAQKMNAEGNGWINTNNGLTGILNKAIFGPTDQIFGSTYSNNIISIADDQTTDWTNVPIVNNFSGIQNMFLTANGILYLNAGKTVRKSIDNGMTYSDITPPNTVGIYRFCVGETGDLFVVNQQTDTVYHSTDQGESWSLLHTFPSSSSFSNDAVKTIAQDSNGIIYVTMSTLEIFNGTFKIYYSADNGLTWNTKVIHDDNINHYDVEVSAKNNQVFVQLGGLLYKFEYNQPNGLTAINPPPGFNYLTAINVDNQGNYYAYNSGLYKSSDEGENWIFLGKPDALPTDTMVDDVLFDSNNRAYIIASRTTLPSQRGFYYVTETLGIGNPVGKTDLKIAPMPAENLLNVDTSHQIKSISIHDMLGKKVFQIDHPENSIDISKLESGMYMLSIQDDKAQIFSMKFIKK